ncbi:MAG: ABC transporter substrate-binding protein [Kiritimatiellales bacterium]|nr:ABC transporter substrate-binding protein [Kiritimatiellales bacterium]
MVFCSLLGCGEVLPLEHGGAEPERIVSMAPNITETIYALGLGDKLVGATTFCTYPDAAKKIPRIGGFGQFNFEAIVSLQPDLVILHEEYDAEIARLKRLGIPYLQTGSYYIADILNTIRSIGLACGAEREADELLARLKGRISAMKTDRQTAPRVLIIFGGSPGTTIDQIHAFGSECIHNELIELAGGVNVVTGKLPYSILSKEAVLRLNPDIIIVLAPEQNNVNNLREAWMEYSSISAVENNRIHILTNDYVCIPGPRFIQILEDFSEIFRQNNLEAE